MQTAEQKEVSIRSERNYGIDILKILAIFMVVILHILGRGGILDACEVGSAQYYVSWLMESLAYCAVNCFAMATGYLMIDKKYKTSRIISLWLQVSFFSIIFTVIMELMSYEVDAKLWFKSFFPASTGLYWYFSAYFGLFFLMPFINKLLNSLSKRQFTLLCTVLLAFFSVINMVKFSDIFSTYSGYDCFWLCIVYIFGAYIKRFNIFEKTNKLWFLLIYIASACVSFVSYVALNQMKDRPFSSIIPDKVLLQYTSPFVVLCAFSLLIFCSKIQLRNKAIKKLVVTLSSLSFGVYIIHLHRLFWIHYLKNAFVSYSEFSPLKLAFMVLITAIAIYLACSIVEWLRVQLFKLFKVEKLSKQIGDKIDSKLKLEL